jgi:hypothetical protein
MGRAFGPRCTGTDTPTSEPKAVRETSAAAALLRRGVCRRAASRRVGECTGFGYVTSIRCIPLGRTKHGPPLPVYFPVSPLAGTAPSAGVSVVAPCVHAVFRPRNMRRFAVWHITVKACGRSLPSAESRMRRACASCRGRRRPADTQHGFSVLHERDRHSLRDRRSTLHGHHASRVGVHSLQELGSQ